MIVSNIVGGLGNQMFQYASGKSLALYRRSNFYIDVEEARSYALHNGYELNRIFKIDNEFSKKKRLEEFGFAAAPLCRKILRKAGLAFFKNDIYFENEEFTPKDKFSTENCYLDGYWQNESYFIEHSSAIRESFVFPEIVDEKNSQLLSQITSSESVAIHVRRGDYVTNLQNASIYECLPLQYFQQAISLIAQKVVAPRYFFFSDDLIWVKENFSHLPNCTFVEGNGGINSYVDMQLMSRCKHAIISNSTFSWWGAWLISSSNRVLIAPKKWFKDRAKGNSIVPSTWFRL